MVSRRWLTAFAALALATDVWAQGFGPQRPLNTDAAVDRRDDSSPRLAADGTGTWVAVWLGQVGGDSDVLMARSVDHGATWTDPRPLDPEAATDGRHDQAAEVAGDGRGNWVAVWQHEPTPREDVIVAARSSDGGATWTPPSRVRSGAATTIDTFPGVATDGTGTWIVVWGSYEPLGSFRVYAARSADGGANWSAPALLREDTSVLRLPRLASAREGRWVVAWQSMAGIEVVRSTDGGASWSLPVLVHASGIESTDQFPDLAGDASGTFVVVWDQEPIVYPRAPPPPGDFGILMTRSTDAGATWSSPERVSVPARGGRVPAVAADGHGNWGVVWEGAFGRRRLRGDGIVMRWSHDGAATWAAPTAVNGAAADKGYDGSPRVATDGRGRWMASWYSGPADDVTDSEVVAVRLSCGCPLCEVCDPSGACVAAPRDGCRRFARGAASTIALSDRTGTGPDRLAWALRAAGPVRGGFDGDPRFDNDVGLCAYGPDGTLVLRATAPAGLHCHDRPCWSGGVRGGWTYRDPGGHPDGVVALAARPGAGRFSILARGTSLVLPVLPAPVPLTAQLQTARGACWEVTYEAATVRESSPRRFVAKAPAPRRAIK